MNLINTSGCLVLKDLIELTIPLVLNDYPRHCGIYISNSPSSPLLINNNRTIIKNSINTHVVSIGISADSTSYTITGNIVELYNNDSGYVHPYANATYTEIDCQGGTTGPYYAHNNVSIKGNTF